MGRDAAGDIGERGIVCAGVTGLGLGQAVRSVSERDEALKLALLEQIHIVQMV